MTALTSGAIATAAGVGLAALVVDQVSKSIARDELGRGRQVDVVPGLLNLTLVDNHGVNFGLGQGLGGVFSVASAVAVPALGAYMLHSGSHPLLTALGTGLAMGGALGNLADRVTNDGGVIDFIGTPVGVCNVADLLLYGGVALMGTAMFIKRGA